MTQVNKNDVTQIFASNAPDQDKPPSFPNYTTGWGTSRNNNGKPTIKGFNFLQQRTDQNFLWIHQNGGALPYDSSIDYVDGSIVLKDGKLQQINGGIWSSYGSSDSDITTWSGNSQADENKKFVTTVNSYSDLSSLKTVDGRVAIVKGDGSYYYSDSQKLWLKDENYNLYDFKIAQPIQYYYDILGDWNDAIEQAQLNIFTKGYSPKMILPAGEVLIKRPIWGGASLGMYLHEKYPDLGIYNATTNTFKMTPDLVIEGQGRGLTTITFAGSKGTADPHDLTWVNYGAINTTPYKPLEQCSGKATVFYHTNWWTRVNLKGFTIQGVNVEANGIRPPVHGITLFRGHRGFIDDVMIVGFTGAGLLCDGYYDSFFKEFEIFQSGRMSPVYGEYLDKGLTTLDYQTYAPLHIMNSAIGDGWDNCNFLRFLNFHIEDCFHAVADIIISGKSAPIWIENTHFECDNTEGTGKLGNKTVLALGSYGVSRFSQDGVEGYVYGSEKFTGNGSGQAYWSGGSGYSWNYDVGLLIGQYSQLNIDNSELTLNVKCDGNNASAQFKANKCVFGNITSFANASQIVISDSTISSYSQDYGLCPKMNNVHVVYGFDIKNNISDMSNMLVLDNVSVDHATGTVNYAKVDIVSRSSTEGTTLYAYNGNFQVIDNYVINNLGK